MANNESCSPADPGTDSLLPVPSVASVIRSHWRRPSASEADPASFPTACLPPDMAAMVEAVALTARVPESLPACCALAAVSASIGKGLVIRSASHRTTPANLYFVASARSGAGKSESFSQIVQPVFEFQHRLIADWRTTTRPGLIAMKLVVESQITKFKAQAARLEAPEDFQALASELARLMSAKAQVDAGSSDPVLVCEDVTTERLAVLLGQNHETLFSASSDGGAVLNNLLGRYSRLKRTDETLYVKAYTGDYCRVDRVSREPVILQQPCLTLCWLVQPDKLAVMFGERSLSEGGMLPRVMACHADTEPAKIDRAAGILPPEVTFCWRQLLFGLLGSYHQHRAEAHVLTPADEAVRLLDEHQHRLVDRRRSDLADADSFAARWNEWAWRLSAVLHAARHGPDAHNHPVAPETASAAIRLADWFAVKQLGLLEHSRDTRRAKQEEAVLELLRLRSKRKWPKSAVCSRDVQRAYIAPTAEDAIALLNRMETEGRLTGKDYSPPSGGHTVRLYRKAGRSR